MAIVEIRLEAGSLDLIIDSEKEFYITKQAHDLRDLNTRNASFSKTISIPRNENNVRLLSKSMIEFASYSLESYKFTKCQVLMAGWPILLEGRLFVQSESITAKTLSISIYGGTIDFFDGLTDFPISTLDWNEFNFEWNLTNIQSYVNTTEGFLFGQSIWFGNEDWEQAQAEEISPTIQLSDPDIRTNGGWLYFKTVVDKILGTMPNLLFDFSELEKLDLYNEMVLAVPLTQLFDNFTAVDGFSGLVIQEGKQEELLPNDTSYIAVFPVVQLDSPIGFWNVAQNEFKITEPGYYDIKINLVLSGIHTEAPDFVGKVKVWHQTTLIKEWFIYETGEAVLNFEDSRYINLNEVIYVVFHGRTSSGSHSFWYWTGDFNVKGSVAVKNNFVTLSEYLPNITQKNFMKEVFKLFNAIPYYENGTIKVKLWDEIPEASEVDLTPYVDTTKEIIATGKVPGYARNNTFKFNNHKTVSRLGTDFTFEMLNDSLPLEKTVVQSSFSASDQSLAGDFVLGAFPLFPLAYSKHVGNPIQVFAGSDAYSTPNANNLAVGDIIFVKNNLGDGFQGRRRVALIGGDTFGTVDVNFTEDSNHDWESFRFTKQDMGLRFGRAGDLVDVTVRDGGSAVTVPNMKGVSFSSALTWPELTKAHYPNLIDMLTKPTVTTAWFRLPNAVFHSLTLLQPIYAIKRRWYLNKLEQYNHTRLCRIELIEIKKAATEQPQSIYFVSFKDEFIGNWADTLPPITEEYLVFNNGQVEQTIDINLQGGTGIGEWSIDVVQMILAPGISQNLTLSFNGSITLGNREVDIHFINQDALEVLRPALVEVVSASTYSVSVNPMDWGVTAGNNITMDTVITNTGLVPIELDLSAISGAVGNFGFVAPTPVGTFIINPGLTQIIRVNYSKQGGAGEKVAQFTIIGVTAGVLDTLINLTATAV